MNPLVRSNWNGIYRWLTVLQGPFQGKNFATTISPWIVTLDALEPFRTDLPERIAPEFPYLDRSLLPSKKLGLDIKLNVAIQPASK